MIEFKSLIGEVELVYKKKEHNKVKIGKSEDGYQFALTIWPDDLLIRECFVVVYLNRSNNVISYYIASKGGISGTVTDVRLIAKTAIDCLASAVLLFHNHPSGNKEPSDSDKSITKRIVNAMKVFDIQVIDHIIIADDNNYFSFSDEGILPSPDINNN